MILTPYGRIPGSFPSEITQSAGPGPSFLCPNDPYYYQRGEAGYYHDTQLGGLGQTVPTDAELSKTYGYTPWNYGWVYGTVDNTTQRAYWPQSWVPPNGWAPGPRAPMALGATSDDLVAELNAHNRRTFQLTMISTIAVAASALLAIFRTGGLIREDAQRRAA